MILNISGRTDIAAFYAPWLLERLRAGFVRVRNPYRPQQVHEYRLTPEATDCLVFCTKNPAPLLALPELVERLRDFETYFFVTMTPYGTDVEPRVPAWQEVAGATEALSRRFGRKRVAWRYDPIFLSASCDVAFHRKRFPRMAERIAPSVHRCVISFLDCYAKTARNAPDLRPPDAAQTEELAAWIGETAARLDLPVSTCAEAADLRRFGIAQEGCISPRFLEAACGCAWREVRHRPLRPDCRCLPSRDIGAYNSCPHGCRYCYANYDAAAVAANVRRHDVHSPFLLGGEEPDDTVYKVAQPSLREAQMRIRWDG